MRECIELVVRGSRLRGTVHVPPEAPGTVSGLEGTGVIILQQGFSPRSWQGDLAVVLADALAKAGIITVRMDLPGFGDSEGDLPEDFLSLIDTIQEGGFTEVACECIDQIQSRLKLQKVILGGHCGGAITDFLATTRRPNNWPAGMFALDTAFHLVRGVQPPARPNPAQPANGSAPAAPAPAPAPAVQPEGNWSERYALLRQELRTAILGTALGGPLQKAAQQTRTILGKIRPRHNDEGSEEKQAEAPAPAELPPQANLKLLASIRQVLDSGMPVLFVDADDPSKPSEFDYMKHIYAGGKGRSIYKSIFGTDHGFLAGDGKPKLIACVIEWIMAEFGKPAKELASSGK
jgi:pimeloyl-ACP methyl ester carboxylesterase